jgi:N-succinyldiaminopimelate aminotransferase
VPRHPDTSPAIREVRASAFSSLAGRLARVPGEHYPFHVGDTWRAAPVGCRMEDLPDRDHPGLNRYAPPRGMPQLLEAIAARIEARSAVSTGPDDILVAAGATGSLDAVCGAILDPGDEVLVLAPFWPLIDGIVRNHRGRPVAVPFLGAVGSAAAAVDAVERRRTERTVALYVSTPNNPTGRCIPAGWLEALAQWARDRDLWILSDEVYEDYAYTVEHVPLRPLAPERTFSVHSCSKAFGMAGYRIGVSTHAFYSTPTPSQVAALRALDGRGDAWVGEARPSYASTGREAARRLGVPEPEGGTFLFLDVEESLDDRGLTGFLEDAVDHGLCLAPGPSFGPYPTHVRMCFSAQEPDVVLRGVDRLAELLGRVPADGS